MTVYIVFDEEEPGRPVALVTTSKEKAIRLCGAPDSPLSFEEHNLDVSK